MIVRPATARDISAAFSALSENSAAEIEAVAADRATSLSFIEYRLIEALPRALFMFALLSSDSARCPGAIMGAWRGANGEVCLAGMTTLWFSDIKRPFWIWFARRFLPEHVDRCGFRSTASVMSSQTEWIRLAGRRGFVEVGRHMVAGVEFTNVERARPAVDGLGARVRSAG